MADALQQEDLPLKNMRRGLGGAVDGAAAEFLVCDEEDLVMMPKHMSMEEGSTLPVAFTTAWSSLFSHHPTLQAGQTVLCLGTGGVSLCAAQVCLFPVSQILLRHPARSHKRSPSHSHVVIGRQAGTSQIAVECVARQPHRRRNPTRQLRQDRQVGPGGEALERRSGRRLRH